MIDLLILAAGRGRRLGRLGDEVPKWLLKVADARIAERQLDGVREANTRVPGTVRSITVVTGHAAEGIERFSAQASAPGSLSLVHNRDYDEINNWFSLLLALRALEGRHPQGRIVVFNGDLLARPAWYAAFLLDSAGTPADALIAVDLERPLTDESMKVSVAAGGDRGLWLDRIGKIGVERPVGEYVGMFMVREEARAALLSTLEGFEGSPACQDHWYEQAIAETARGGTSWLVWPTPDSRWIEIDDQLDYELALKMGEPA